jgi:hypothetical protein
MFQKSIHLLLFALCLTGGLSAQGFSARKGGHCYMMDIPDYMTRAYNLNDAASLQYQNLDIPAFLIVIEDEKTELDSLGMTFKGAAEFLDFFTRDFKKDAAGRRLGETARFTSNGNAHAQTELYWKEEDTEFFMLVTTVESAGYYYKILCWAPSEAKARLEADFRRASKSIRE